MLVLNIALFIACTASVLRAIWLVMNGKSKLAGRPAIVSAISLVLFLSAICLTPTSTPGSAVSAPAGAAQQPRNSSPPVKVIAKVLKNGAFDLVVGHSHHVQEAMTEQADAMQLILAREAKGLDPRATIAAAYQKESYRHFGNDGEAEEPLCKVSDQDSVPVDGTDGALNFGSTVVPVACTLDDGSTLYVTSWER